MKRNIFAQMLHDCIGLDWRSPSNQAVLAHRASTAAELWRDGVQKELTALYENNWRAHLCRWILKVK